MSENFENLRAINDNIIARKVEHDEKSSQIIEIKKEKDIYCKAVVVSAGDNIKNIEKGDELIINAIAPVIHKDDDGNEYYCLSEEQIYCRVR